MFALVTVVITLFVADAKLFGTKSRTNPVGAVYAQYDASKQANIVFDEGSLKYSSFSTQVWRQKLMAKKIGVELMDLNEIYDKVKHAIVGDYAEFSTYVRPDKVTNKGGFIFGAWKIQIYVNKRTDIWKYRIAQGEKEVVCKQNMYRKEKEKFFGITIDTDEYRWTETRACSIGVISGLINNVIDDVDKVWNRKYHVAIGHNEL